MQRTSLSCQLFWNVLQAPACSAWDLSEKITWQPTVQGGCRGAEVSARTADQVAEAGKRTADQAGEVTRELTDQTGNLIQQGLRVVQGTTDAAPRCRGKWRGSRPRARPS